MVVFRRTLTHIRWTSWSGLVPHELGLDGEYVFLSFQLILRSFLASLWSVFWEGCIKIESRVVCYILLRRAWHTYFSFLW